MERLQAGGEIHNIVMESRVGGTAQKVYVCREETKSGQVGRNIFHRQR